MKIEIFNELNKVDEVFAFIFTVTSNDIESIREELTKTVSHQDDFVLVAREQDTICGVFLFFAEPQNEYLELTRALANSQQAYEALMEYLSSHYANYQLDVVIKSSNPMLEQALKQRSAEFYPLQVKLQLADFKEYESSMNIVEYQPKFRDDYLAIHSTDVYWIGERVLERLDIFKVFLAVEGNRVVGYVDTTYKSAENEPYDLFVKAEYRAKGYGKALVSEMVKAILPNKVFVFVEADNLPALSVYQAVGFVPTGDKLQTVTVKL